MTYQQRKERPPTLGQDKGSGAHFLGRVLEPCTSLAWRQEPEGSGVPTLRHAQAPCGSGERSEFKMHCSRLASHNVVPAPGAAALGRLLGMQNLRPWLLRIHSLTSSLMPPMHTGLEIPSLWVPRVPREIQCPGPTGTGGFWFHGGPACPRVSRFPWVCQLTAPPLREAWQNLNGPKGSLGVETSFLRRPQHRPLLAPLRKEAFCPALPPGGHKET